MQNYKHYKGKARLVDYRCLDIIGVRDMVLKMTLGTNWTLNNVKFIDLKRMLITVRRLNNEGHHVTFGIHKCKVKKQNLGIAEGKIIRIHYI